MHWRLLRVESNQFMSDEAIQSVQIKSNRLINSQPMKSLNQFNQFRSDEAVQPGEGISGVNSVIRERKDRGEWIDLNLYLCLWRWQFLQSPEWFGLQQQPFHHQCRGNHVMRWKTQRYLSPFKGKSNTRRQLQVKCEPCLEYTRERLRLE
jgi:hypothetical protein